MLRLSGAVALSLALIGAAIAQPNVEMKPAQSDVQSLEIDGVEAWLDGLVPYALDEGGMAGAVVAIVANGEILTVKGYGTSDVESGEPVDPDATLFRPGSISKLFTWTAVMQQVERGALNLDRDLNEYLDFSIPAFLGQPLTLRHLLTHTAGFEEQAKYVLAYDRAASPDLDDYVRISIPSRIYAPGTVPAYSNYGTALAGYIVQRATRRPFADYVAKKIFQPLGMESATFSQDLSEAQRQDLSNGYQTSDSNPSPFEFMAASPAGALTISAPDMAKFMLAHLNGGRLGDSRILEASTARLMHTRASAAIPALNGMTLGLYESSINGRRVLSHAGDTAVFHSGLHLFVDEKVGIYISVNSTGVDGAAQKLRTLLFTQFGDRYFPAGAAAEPVDIGQENARSLAGQWTSSRRSATSFLALAELLSPVHLSANERGQLHGINLPILGPAVSGWTEVEPMVWQSRNSHERLAAAVDESGVTRFSLDTLAPIMVFEPVPWHRVSNWVLPGMLLGLGVLSLTGLQWPVAAVVRRHYRSRLGLQGSAMVAYHGVRASAVAMVAALVGWLLFVTSGFSDPTMFGDGSDSLVQALQVLTIAGSAALAPAAAVNLYHSLRDQRGFWSIVGALSIVSAAVPTIWVAFAFNLMRLGTSY